MVSRLLVIASLVFLIGSIAAITYLDFFSGNRSVETVAETREFKIIPKTDIDYAFSIKRLDSLSAAFNYRFTKSNAVNRPLSKL